MCDSHSMHKLHPFLGEGLFKCADLQQDTFTGCYLFKNVTGACGVEPLAKCPLSLWGAGLLLAPAAGRALTRHLREGSRMDVGCSAVVSQLTFQRFPSAA